MKHILGIFIFAVVLASAATATDLFLETDAAYEASQEARNKGVAAFREGDLETALTHMEEAFRHRPNHPLLLGYIAYLAAETGNRENAMEAAKRYAAMGIAPGADIRLALKNALGDEAAALEKQFEANLAAQGSATTKFMLPTEFRLVEGIARDGQGRFYFGTVVSGEIVRMDATGPVQIVDAKQHEFGSFFGMTFHDGSLYATFAHMEQTFGYTEGEGQTGIARINPDTGDIQDVWTLPGGTENQQLADITVTQDGAIFASDAKGGQVYQITGDTLFPLFAHDGFMSPQGLAETSDGHLILADYGRGLWHLDRKSGQITLLGAPADVSLHGIDGLARHGNSLIAIQNGVTPHRILALTLSADGKSVTDVTVKAKALPTFDEPTLGVSAPDGFYFVAGSQWPKYEPGGFVREGAEVAPTTIMKLD
ncbi:hypothetical protein [Kordiimonas lacus]|uniref:Uncharacterized protein n=1 Tax=Kordiimonas lacus TaxID=637679 RepID=A0A1G6TW98_9PROT|nr:hypothetical protein [Kordiimonas lacus]SDD33184.1 hypothetical protein SAMN04488071_0378 [Kordiimonas lacus]